MLVINTPDDLASAEQTEERTAFLQALLNDYITFDDADYPEGYEPPALSPDGYPIPGPDGPLPYIPPRIRREWNAGAAAAWGFPNRAAIEAALPNPYGPISNPTVD